MKMRTKAIISAVIAVIAAVGILIVAAFTGIPFANSGQALKQASPGTLTVLITDPPHVPSGVTAVYVAYSDLSVHISEAGQLSGWVTLSSKGEINLMSTINVSQTIASVKVPNGDYNSFRFNITSAKVEFNGKNFTAFVPHSELFIPITHGGIEVNDSKPSATIIDVSPMVINIGSQSNPEFIIRPTAVAFPIPSGQVTEDMEHIGFRMKLLGKSWWASINEQATANLRITAASLSGNSLTVSVLNTGGNTSIRLVVVSQLATALMGNEHEHVPSTLIGSDVFLVEKNGSLVPLQQVLKNGVEDRGKADIASLLGGVGYNLTSGASATFHYTGNISLGLFGLAGLTNVIVPGQQYIVTVLGSNALASTVVVAS